MRIILFSEVTLFKYNVSTILSPIVRKCESKHWYACGADGRTDGRSVGHVIIKFSGMGRFIYPWCYAGALRARSSAKIKLVISQLTDWNTHTAKCMVCFDLFLFLFCISTRSGFSKSHVMYSWDSDARILSLVFIFVTSANCGKFTYVLIRFAQTNVNHFTLKFP